MGMWRHRWKAEEDAQVLHLRVQRGFEFADIAQAIGGVTAMQCRQRYFYIRERIRAAANQRPASKTAPNTALIDRERRLNARDERDYAALARGDVTPLFFGDPPPGFSALDKRMTRA